MQLPYSIWKMIVLYLPAGVTKKLYTVNSALFNIVMDQRYQDARLWTGSPKALVRKDLRVFRYPGLSCRPKILHLDLSSIAKSLSLENNKGSLGLIIPFIVNLTTRSKFGSEIVAIGLDALPQLTAVTNLKVIHDYSGPCCDHPLVLRLLDDVFQIFRDRLQSLEVRVAVENLQLLLPASLQLPQLESLTIHTVGLNSIAANACGKSIIPTVVKSHASSLRSVSFTTDNAAVDPRPIFRSLQDIPCLSGIHMSFPFGPSVPRPFPMYDMLYSCRHDLEFLSLEFGTYMRDHASRSLFLFREDWCFIKLPRLRELRIDPPIKTFNQDFVNYIRRFSPSLISFCIKSHLTLHLHQIKTLISCNFLSLRNLSIYVHMFCPDILIFLARTLPRLQTLTLGFVSISHVDKGIITNLSLQFYRAMQPHLGIFSEWQLTSLDYFDCSFPAYIPPIQKALADHLPNVEWYCGVERSTYISQAPELPEYGPSGIGITSLRV